MQLSDIRNRSLSLLHEPSDSTLADLPTGVGGTSTIVTTAQLNGHINDGAADMCRRGFRLDETGTATIATGTQYVAFSSLTTTGGHTIRGARTVQYNGTQLTYYGLPFLENRYPTYQTDANATPLFWYLDGERGIGLYPTPSSNSGVVKIVGVVGQPVLLSADGDTPSWLPTDRHNMLSLYAAYMVAKSAIEDASIRPRSQAWEDEYEQGISQMLERLWESDPLTTAVFFPRLPQPPTSTNPPTQ